MILCVWIKYVRTDTGCIVIRVQFLRARRLGNPSSHLPPFPPSLPISPYLPSIHFCPRTPYIPHIHMYHPTLLQSINTNKTTRDAWSNGQDAHTLHPTAATAVVLMRHAKVTNRGCLGRVMWESVRSNRTASNYFSAVYFIWGMLWEVGISEDIVRLNWTGNGSELCRVYLHGQSVTSLIWQSVHHGMRKHLQ